MVVPSESDELVHSVRLSSVGPGRVTGTDVVHSPTGLDLAAKLHYLRGVYLFGPDAAEGLTSAAIKEAMFTSLNGCYYTCGRFRRDESGRPFIKCNDCGARFVDAVSDRTAEEWAGLLLEDPALDRSLAYQQHIGPEIQFSPTVFVQVTRLKCGGMCLGLSWAHVLGDPYSASQFLIVWGRILAQFKSNGEAQVPRPEKNIQTGPSSPTANTTNGSGRLGAPLSVKRVDPVGDLWVTANDLKMETFSFHLSASQVTHLQEMASPIHGGPFEAICASIWQSIAKTKPDLEPRIVTICKKDPHTQETDKNDPHTQETDKSDPHTQKIDISCSTQIVSTVSVDFSVANASLKELANAMINEVVDERTFIENEVEKDNGVSDFVLYGANLTFVDLEGADLYGLEVNGHKPFFVGYTIQGVGDNGVVLVLPGPVGDNGKVVTVTLPESDVSELKSELKRNGLLIESDLG